VSTRLSGTVAGVFVEDNQPVQVGQLLVQLDPRDYEVALARAQAELAQARAQLAALSPTVPITATTNVTQIATTAGDVDTARAAIAAAERDYQSALAHVRAAEAAVERAKLDLSYTKIVAPVAGVVGRRSVEPGQRVQPGEALVAVVELDTLWVTANFKETQLRRLRVGQPARISVDALGVKLDGSVESLAGASGARYSLLPPENATGNYVKVVQRLPVRIKLLPNQDPHRQLRIGMSVEPTVALR
jgi:membrane fusion protein (multidrug efflux system)